MEINGRLNEEELREWAKEFESRKGRAATILLLCTLSLLALAEGTYWAFFEVTRTLGLAMTAVGLVLGIVSVIYWPLHLRRWIRRTLHNQRDCLIRANEEGLEFLTDISKTLISWTAFSETRETPGLILIRAPRIRWFGFPKRVLPEEDLKELRELLARKIKVARAANSSVES